MKVQEIRSLARSHGVKTSRKNKIELIHAIQQTEGNFDCFATARDGYCDQLKCIWRSDCFDSASKLKQ